MLIPLKVFNAIITFVCVCVCVCVWMYRDIILYIIIYHTNVIKSGLYE